MVRVPARCFDVNRHSPGLREAREHVRPETHVGVDTEIRVRPPTEVDRGARQGIVHRHDGVAVTRDAATIAERGVERVAEGQGSVLGRVVLARLQVARALDDEVESAVERQLLEEVVVDPRAGRDANAAAPVERQPGREPRLGGRADAPHGPAAGHGRPAERLEQARPVLGICLGLQLALEETEEDGGIAGLALLPGRAVRLRAGRIPRMGWAEVETRAATGAAYYFAHSYAAVTPAATAWSEGVVAEARAGSFVGVQFHPEKSGPAGARYLSRLLTGWLVSGGPGGSRSGCLSHA